MQVRRDFGEDLMVKFEGERVRFWGCGGSTVALMK